MHAPQNNQSPTQNEYRSMRFVAIDSKFLIIINNYFSYNI